MSRYNEDPPWWSTCDKKIRRKLFILRFLCMRALNMQGETDDYDDFCPQNQA